MLFLSVLKAWRACGWCHWRAGELLFWLVPSAPCSTTEIQLNIKRIKNEGCLNQHIFHVTLKCFYMGNKQETSKILETFVNLKISLNQPSLKWEIAVFNSETTILPTRFNIKRKTILPHQMSLQDKENLPVSTMYHPQRHQPSFTNSKPGQHTLMLQQIRLEHCTSPVSKAPGRTRGRLGWGSLFLGLAIALPVETDLAHPCFLG